jgi:lysophospholipase L1-like esterase
MLGTVLAVSQLAIERKFDSMGHFGKMVIGRREVLGMGTSILAGSALAGCASSGDSQGVSTDVATDVSVAAAQGNVRILGRTYEEDGVTWLPLSGSAVEFVATGERVELELVGNESTKNKADLCPRYAVLVDGEVAVDETLTEQSRVVTVELQDASAEATVRLILLSEANGGPVGIRSVKVTNAVGASVRPSEPKGLSIGFIGDSMACGYCVEASSNDATFQTTTENFMKSYAYLAAQELDADHEAVCYSGFGGISGFTGNGDLNGDWVLPPVYELVVKGRDEVWDFAAHPKDVIVLNLGTNDLSYVGVDEGSTAEFVEGYTEFLDKIRELNPDSYIICTMGTMWGAGVLYPSIEKAIADHANRMGDERITSYLSDPINTKTDTTVANGHPDAEGHRKIAEQLVGVVRQVLQA